MAITTHDHHPTLRHVERDALGVALQRVLVDLVGPHFRPLHLQLDDLVDSARDLADQVAERARALAWTPDGRRSTVASASALPEAPEGEIRDAQVIALVTALLVQAIATARSAMDDATEYDPVTEDLLHQVVDGLEQHAWMFSAQAA